MYIADEAFFTGTAAEVTPIRELDGRTIGEGCRGPVTESLQKTYFDLVHGRHEHKPEWLSYVWGRLYERLSGIKNTKWQKDFWD